MKNIITILIILFYTLTATAQYKKAKALPRLGDLVVLFPLSAKGSAVTDVNNLLQLLPYNESDADKMVFKIVKGLDGGSTVSIESVEKSGEYFFYNNGLIEITPFVDTAEFKTNASFKLKQSFRDDDAMALEVVSSPGNYVHANNYSLDVATLSPNVSLEELSFYFKTVKTDFIASQAAAAVEALKADAKKVATSAGIIDDDPLFKLTVNVVGRGAVQVNGNTCTDRCEYMLKKKKLYFTALIAVPDYMQELKSWSGAACGEDAICTVPSEKNISVTANFAKAESMRVEVKPPPRGYIETAPNKRCYSNGSGECVVRLQMFSTAVFWANTQDIFWKTSKWSGLCEGQPVTGFMKTSCVVSVPEVQNQTLTVQQEQISGPRKVLELAATLPMRVEGHGGSCFLRNPLKLEFCRYEFPEGSAAYIYSESGNPVNWFMSPCAGPSSSCNLLMNQNYKFGANK